MDLTSKVLDLSSKFLSVVSLFLDLVSKLFDLVSPFLISYQGPSAVPSGYWGCPNRNGAAEESKYTRSVLFVCARNTFRV